MQERIAKVETRLDNHDKLFEKMASMHQINNLKQLVNNLIKFYQEDAERRDKQADRFEKSMHEHSEQLHANTIATTQLATKYDDVENMLIPSIIKIVSWTGGVFLVAVLTGLGRLMGWW